MALPSVLHHAMASWLNRCDPGWLENQATAHADLTPILRQEFGNKAAVLRTALTRRDRVAIQHLGADDWDELLTWLVAHVPAQGKVLWTHQAWYRQQMDAVHRMAIQMIGTSRSSFA